MDKVVIDSILERVKCIKKNFLPKESCRLSTFSKGWPHDWLCKYKLAEAGLFYTGVSDAVMCAFSDIILYKWEFGDQPIIEHYKYSRKCLFLFDPKKCLNVADVNLRNEELETLLENMRISEGYDEVDG